MMMDPWGEKTTAAEPPPGWGWVKVRKDFLQPTAASMSGQGLQTLVGAQDSFAVWAIVVHVLQSIHAEGDEAAARHAPQQAQAPAGEPGEGAGAVAQPRHDHLVAGGTAHLDRAIEERDGLLHIYSLHGNGIGVGDGHRLRVVCGRIHALPIGA